MARTVFVKATNGWSVFAATIIATSHVAAMIGLLLRAPCLCDTRHFNHCGGCDCHDLLEDAEGVQLFFYIIVRIVVLVLYPADPVGLQPPPNIIADILRSQQCFDPRSDALEVEALDGTTLNRSVRPLQQGAILSLLEQFRLPEDVLGRRLVAQ